MIICLSKKTSVVVVVARMGKSWVDPTRIVKRLDLQDVSKAAS